MKINSFSNLGFHRWYMVLSFHWWALCFSNSIIMPIVHVTVWWLHISYTNITLASTTDFSFPFSFCMNLQIFEVHPLGWCTEWRIETYSYNDDPLHDIVPYIFQEIITQFFYWKVLNTSNISAITTHPFLYSMIWTFFVVNTESYHRRLLLSGIGNPDFAYTLDAGYFSCTHFVFPSSKWWETQMMYVSTSKFTYYCIGCLSYRDM